MKKLLRHLLLGIGLCLPGYALATPIIMLDPASSSGNLGDTITIDILWDGSADPAYLGAWDVDIAFDASILSFSSATFDFGVDSFGCIPGITCDAVLAPGLLDIYEFSLDDIATLMANQDGLGNMFRLASIDFVAIGEGLSSLSFTGPFLTFGDEQGGAISPILRDASVCIGANGCTQIPEPAGLLLFVGGLLLVAQARKTSKI
ncbi:cohesin domain-containing protein [Bowmanella pacifica]|uniref:PEP-CTERM protein-sorting domain-containing protein n=1 Tax=Bowmanella pacifica TaxID=502051 RepID=A0A918DLN9_9ALTE|nr:cohesin domain-containing protein [Bowmanella pacifica]GGO74137.1 hypothetical protein GCM10010982_36240 [Bowmanella pacifica]